MVGQDLSGMLFREKVLDSLTDRLRGAFESKIVSQSPVDSQIPSSRVEEVDALGQVVHHGVEQGPFLDQRRGLLRQSGGAFLHQAFQAGPVLPQLLLGAPAQEELPHPLHEEGQLPDVRLVVFPGLVPHPRHQDDPAPIEHGDVHVADDLDVTRGSALEQGIGGGVVVGDDRAALPHRFSPEARCLQGKDHRLLLDGAAVHGRFRPYLHGEHRLVLVHEGEIADPALGQSDPLLQGELHHVSREEVRHLVQLEQGLKAGLVEAVDGLSPGHAEAGFGQFRLEVFSRLSPLGHCGPRACGGKCNPKSGEFGYSSVHRSPGGAVKERGFRPPTHVDNGRFQSL